MLVVATSCVLGRMASGNAYKVKAYNLIYVYNEMQYYLQPSLMEKSKSLE